MTEQATTKLTKREFDRATNALYQAIERPIATAIDFGEMKRGKKDDYFTLQTEFEVPGMRVFGLPVVLLGRVYLNRDRDRIGLNARIRYTTERKLRLVEDAELWGEYDVYQGQWTLRWL